MLWLILGLIAVFMAVFNILWYSLGKNPKFFRFASLSFTALTISMFLLESSLTILYSDWASVEDVIPFGAHALTVLVIASIIINSFTLLKVSKKEMDKMKINDL